MGEQRRIIVVSELFYPEESATAHIMTRIAARLAQHHDVLVITGPESYEGDPRRITNVPGAPDAFQVLRVWAPRLDKNKLLQRALRLVATSVSLVVVVFVKANRGDTVFYVTNPAPIVVLLGLIKRLKGCKLVMLAHDIFPENAAATGLLKKDSLKYRLVKSVFDWGYTVADRVISIGRDMADIINQKLKKPRGATVSVIPNWADVVSVRPIARLESNIPTLGLQDKLVVQYAGNIGRAQGLAEFSRLLKEVQNPHVHFVFAGSGALKPILTQSFKHAKNVTLLDAYSRGDQTTILGSCDIALITLHEDMYGLGVPSKAYNILASGRPILYIGPKGTEIYTLVKESRVGWAFDWTEWPAVREFLGSLSLGRLDEILAIGSRARLVAEEAYAESVVLDRIEAAIAR